MATVLVTIPDHLEPGSDLLVTHLDSEFTVVLPPGAFGGSTLEVVLPSQPAPTMRLVDVELPPGCQPGDEITVAGIDGAAPFTMLVPDWAAGGGTTVQVEVPAAAESRDGCAPTGGRLATDTGTTTYDRGAGDELKHTYGGDMKDDDCISAYASRVKSW